MKARPSDAYLSAKTWEEKARENPLYGVMSDERFADSGNPTDEELDIFYSQGRKFVSRWISPWLIETETAENADVLEFGCGMGRLTNALAESHSPEHIYGLDISPTMIEYAKKYTNKAIGYEIVRADSSFPFEDEQFQRIYSYAVFQHIATGSVVEKSIAEIGRVLAKGGYVRLNFEMVFGPPFMNRLPRDTFAYEKRYICYGWKRVFNLPLWGFRVNQADNWVGIRPGFKQLVRLFRNVGIEIYGIVKEPSTSRMVWFYGRKL